jgi:hypothetical protein
MSIAQRLLDESIKRQVRKERVEAYRQAVLEVSEWVANTQPRGEILAMEISGKFKAPKNLDADLV